MADVLFVAAHPDDETLGMGVAIAEHIAAGHNVNVLIMSRSVGSGVLDQLNGSALSSWWGVIHNPSDEGYSPLTSEAFGIARSNEAITALDCLATGLGTYTLFEGNLPEFTLTEAQDRILDVCTTISAGAVLLKGHSHLVDDHAEHVIVGNALKNISLANPTLYGNRRHYILPRYWTDSRLSTVAEHWDLPTNAGISARALNACRSYAAWAPPDSYAIGAHSVPDMWPVLMQAPKCMYHS